MLEIARPHPKQKPALVQLPLQVVGVVIVDELGKSRTEEPAGAAGHGCSEERAGEGAAGGHHGTAGDHGADVHEPADQPTLGVADRFERDVCGARHPRVVFEFGDLAVSVTELRFDRVLGCEQAELGAIEARVEQLVDRLLKGSGVMEDADGFAKSRGRANLASRVVHRLFPVESSTRPGTVARAGLVTPAF
jgi:hypothetical protein